MFDTARPVEFLKCCVGRSTTLQQLKLTRIFTCNIDYGRALPACRTAICMKSDFQLMKIPAHWNDQQGTKRLSNYFFPCRTEHT